MWEEIWLYPLVFCMYHVRMFYVHGEYSCDTINTQCGSSFQYAIHSGYVSFSLLRHSCPFPGMCLLSSDAFLSPDFSYPVTQDNTLVPKSTAFFFSKHPCVIECCSLCQGCPLLNFCAQKLLIILQVSFQLSYPLRCRFWPPPGSFLRSFELTRVVLLYIYILIVRKKFFDLFFFSQLTLNP